MSKGRPIPQCPIPGCVNRVWASKGLRVCGDCANEVMHHLKFGQKPEVPTETLIEMRTLRRIIATQSKQLKDLRGEDNTAARNVKSPATHGVIYYLRVGAYLKIGWTADLAKRMRAYSPDSILLATEPGTRSDEARRHKMFSTHRTHGREWYALVPSLMHHIDQVAAEHGKPDPVTFAAQPVEIPQPRTIRPVIPRGWSGRV